MKLNIVPARTGLTWVKQGIRTFMQQPLAMSGLFFLYMAAGAFLSFVPVIGSVLALVIVPAATLGLMAATQEATKGKFPMPTVLISAFRAGNQRLRAMLILGVIYAGLSLAVVLIAGQLIDAPMTAPKPGEEALMLPQLQITLLVTSLLYMPVSLLFWHAPALVHWHGISPMKSMFFSFVACIRNTRAFLVFGLAWFGVLVILGSIATLIAVISGSPQFMTAAMVPLALLVAAMFSTSIFFTFQDSFLETPDDTAEVETPLP